MEVVANAKSIDSMKEVLMIISYIEKNAPKYLKGIKSKFNNSEADYSEIVNKFANFPQKISNIRETIDNKLAQANVTMDNDELVELKEMEVLMLLMR